MIIGTLLFVVGVLPTYVASICHPPRLIMNKHELIQLKKSDDDLIADTKSRIYDLVSARPMSMDQKLYYKCVMSLKETIITRYKLYMGLLQTSDNYSNTEKYYQNRSMEFYDLLQKINAY